MSAKQKLAAVLDRHPIPEFIASIPIRKTRAGLQFTCASPTLGGQKDVWVCNSDGYVGQVCVLSLVPEPTVTSCNGVCNARILCVASVPAFLNDSDTSPITNSSTARIDDTQSVSVSSARTSRSGGVNVEKNVSVKSGSSTEGTIAVTGTGNRDIQLDSSSSSEDSDEMTESVTPGGTSYAHAGPGHTNSTQLSSSAPQTQSLLHHELLGADEADAQQSTMWLGTEDGCVHVYNCTDNIRIKKNKIKMQLSSSVYSIL